MQTTELLDDDQVMNLVELVLSLPRDERSACLKEACGGDAALYGVVWNYIQAEERMNGFLLDPLCPSLIREHTFEPGELVDSRFRVIREVARGGMGVVYEVFDEKLERRVAIKCAKAGFNRRLPPEVRNAREISHPNVCRIFEMHTAATDRGEIDFITMEFLDGETLAERLRRGPLPETEARTIARQLCAGLAEAHRRNVIHGDLKSGNIILTNGAGGSMRAVITDFGLARGVGASQGNTQSVEAGGTPYYMAPELWKGEKASVASDIYALGVILFELIGGKRARSAEAPTISLEERINWKPPAVHPKWDRILARCLDPDPANRFRDADEIAEAFAPPSRRWLLTAAAAIALVAVSGVITWQSTVEPKESVRLALAPFESDQATSQLSGDLFRDTAEQLSRVKGNDHTRFAFVAARGDRRITDPFERAVELKATEVLHGTLSSENGKVIVTAYLTDAHSGLNATEWKAEYELPELRYIPVALAGVVTEALHLTPLAPAPMKAAARQAYEMGIKDTRQNSTIDAALPLLESAVGADPDSALTHAGLAEAQWFKYVITKDQVWLERARELVKAAEKRNSDLAAVHRIRGALTNHDGRYEQAIADYLRAIEIEPGNSDAYRRLGITYENNNQRDKALGAYLKAVEVARTYFKPYQDLGAFYYHAGNYHEAARQFETEVWLAPGESGAHFALGTAYVELGYYDQAEDEFRTALTQGETPSLLDNLGVVLMDEGRDSEAITYFRRSLNLSPGASSLSWINLATALRRTGRGAESAEANRKGLELAEKEMSRDPRNSRVRSRLAYLCARRNERGRAESEIAQALQLSPNDADTVWFAAVTWEALGRRDETLKLLTTAPPGVLRDLSHWPDVADLAKDPRFINLLASGQMKH
jgi:tetratricopeptide (TPR) repeat protein/TolB-like protein